MAEPQIIYILRNEAMPGLIKIGRTGGDLTARMKQLYTTGVPVPFTCVFAMKIVHQANVEKTMHFAFASHQFNKNREFFKMEPEPVIAVLKLLGGEEVTTMVQSVIQNGLEPEDKAAEVALKKRRKVLDFKDLGIDPGEELQFHDGTAVIKVLDSRKVEFEGDPVYLVTPTRKLLKLAEDYPLQPSPYWTYKGKTLKDLYEEFHSAEGATE